MAEKRLGIYFAKNEISIVETLQAKILKSLRIPYTAFSYIKQETPGSFNLIDLFANKEGFIKSFTEKLQNARISARKAFVGPPNKDIFIRGFKMMLLSKGEIDAGINFESRKYIPFKTNELTFDYQWRSDKKFQKMDVFYVAILNDFFNNLTEVLTGCGLQLENVEPAIFSLARILAITKSYKEKSTIALLCVNGFNAEFALIDRGFPCFSRDMLLTDTAASDSGNEPAVLSKLTSEIRVSLDYLRRQFNSLLSVDKVFLFTENIPDPARLQKGLEDGLNLTLENIGTNSVKAAKTAVKDMDMLRAYALTLKDQVRLNLTIDLLKKRKGMFASAKEALQGKGSLEAGPDIKILKQYLLLSLAIVAGAYLMPGMKIDKLSKKLKTIQYDVSALLPEDLSGLSLNDLNERKSGRNSLLQQINQLIEAYAPLSPAWDSLPDAISGGLWLDEFNLTLKDNKKYLLIKGMVYLQNQDEEITMVNNFVKNLENNPAFMKKLRKIVLKSVNRAEFNKHSVTQFEITGS